MNPLENTPHSLTIRQVLIRSLGLLIILGISFSITRPPVNAQGDPASETFQLINQFRASMGLPPFEYNHVLASAAQRHANWMAANVIFSHTGDGGSSPLSRATDAGYNGYVIENIVGGGSMSPRQGLIWWQNSPIHYNTLVHERYPQAGVAFATDGVYNMYVLVVGRPSGAYAAPPRDAPAETSKPLIITPIKLAEPREDGSIVHTMRPGQALWTVAAYYDVDLAHLYLINSLDEDAVLHPGNEVTVRLADGQEPPPTPTPPLTHVIRDGESAWSIALQHGIDTGYLYQLNNMDENSVLHPGNEVIVRLAEGQPPLPTPTPRTYHTVRSGESLWAVAAQYNLTLDQLMELNNLTAQSVILQGDQLLIRPLDPTPLPVTPQAPVAIAAGSYPAQVNENNTTPSAAYPNPATAVSQFAASSATPTPSLTGPAENQPQDNNSGNTIRILFVAAVLLLLAIALVLIIRQLRDSSFLP